MILCANFVILVCYWCVKQLAEWLVVIREGLAGCEVRCRELVVGVFYVARGGCCGRCMLLVLGREVVSLLSRRMSVVGVAGLLEVLELVNGVGGIAWALGPAPSSWVAEGRIGLPDGSYLAAEPCVPGAACQQRPTRS